MFADIDFLFRSQICSSFFKRKSCFIEEDNPSEKVVEEELLL